MHLLSPATLSWDGVLAWTLVWAEGLLGELMVDLVWSSGPFDFEVCGDVCVSGAGIFWEEPVLDVEVDWVLTVAVVFGGSGVGAEVDERVVGWAGCFVIKMDVFVGSVVFAVLTGAVWAVSGGLVGMEAGRMWCDVVARVSGTGACVVKLFIRFVLFSASEGVVLLVSTEREREHYVIMFITVGKDHLGVCK